MSDDFHSVKKIVYINSVLGNFIRAKRPEEAALFDYFGYRFIKKKCDLLYTKPGSWRIRLRGCLGMDVGVGWDLFLRLRRGAKVLYIMSMPDVCPLIPWVKKFFPETRIIAWTWTVWSVRHELKKLRHCDHIICLTEGALYECRRKGLGEKAIHLLEGLDAKAFNQTEFRHEFEVGLVGGSERDFPLAVEALKRLRPKAACSLGAAVGLKRVCGFEDGLIEISRTVTGADVMSLTKRCKLIWIPLIPQEHEPVGYSNIQEALLCGTAVVIADSSVLPKSVLSLPGVYLYQAGSVDSLVKTTAHALRELNEKEHFRIQEMSSRLLDGQALFMFLKEQSGGCL